MKPDELAQACVDCGVGETDHHNEIAPYGIACLDGSDQNWCTADQFIRDGRVVLATMEKCIGMTVSEMEIDSGYGRGWEVFNCFAPGTNKTGGQDYKYTKANNESLAIAINTACVEALNE